MSIFDQKGLWPNMSFATGVRDKVAEWAQTTGLIPAVGRAGNRGNRNSDAYDDEMAVSRDDFANRVQVNARFLAKSQCSDDGAQHTLL
jgi:hypothetical protein